MDIDDERFVAIERALSEKWRAFVNVDLSDEVDPDVYVYEREVPVDAYEHELLGQADLLMGFRVPLDSIGPVGFEVTRKGTHDPKSFRMDYNAFKNNYTIPPGGAETAIISYALIITGQTEPLILNKMPGDRIVVLYADIVDDDVITHLVRNPNDSFRLSEYDTVEEW